MHRTKKKKKHDRDFPGGLVVDSVMPMQGAWVWIPGQGTKMPCAPQSGKKNKNKNKKPTHTQCRLAQ